MWSVGGTKQAAHHTNNNMSETTTATTPITSVFCAQPVVEKQTVRGVAATVQKNEGLPALHLVHQALGEEPSCLNPLYILSSSNFQSTQEPTRSVRMCMCLGAILFASSNPAGTGSQRQLSRRDALSIFKLVGKFGPSVSFTSSKSGLTHSPRLQCSFQRRRGPCSGRWSTVGRPVCDTLSSVGLLIANARRPMTADKPELSPA